MVKQCSEEGTFTGGKPLKGRTRGKSGMCGPSDCRDRG